MFFAIHMLDKPGSEELRAAKQEAHRNFVRQHAQRIVLGGPLLAEDGQRMIGSLIILDCKDREEAERFIESEPYGQADLFESVLIRPFMAVLSRSEPGKAEGQPQ